MPLRCRDRVTCSADGPGTPVAPGIDKTSHVLCLFQHRGIANTIARVCSVLPFHAINTFVAICLGGIGCTSRIGRPLSNELTPAHDCASLSFGTGPPQDNKVEDPAIAAHCVRTVGGTLPARQTKGRIPPVRNAGRHVPAWKIRTRHAPSLQPRCFPLCTVLATHLPYRKWLNH